MSPVRRMTLGAALAAVAIMAPLPALASQGAGPQVPGCTPSTTHQTAPAPGATVTYSAGNAGTVAIARSRTDSTLYVKGATPASGYTARVVTAVSTTVKVVFNNATSGSKTVFTAHLGSTNPNKIAIHLSVC